MTARSTPEARLVDAGWHPPTETLAAAIRRREALRSAIDGLKTRGRADETPIRRAVADGDRDDVLTAVVSDAIGRWLDSELQRPDTLVTALSFELEQALLESVYGDAAAILASLPESLDAAYLRGEAERATATNTQLFDASGRPAPTRLGRVSLSRAMVAR